MSELEREMVGLQGRARFAQVLLLHGEIVVTHGQQVDVDRSAMCEERWNYLNLFCGERKMRLW